ncbi:hypothetical protein HDU79_005133 [Rhizoclosmatium sp. JEL0117]|nr:hypothetical protein HDU79_005133 [Rhizoclosmatium sp. JEL0117]
MSKYPALTKSLPPIVNAKVGDACSAVGVFACSWNAATKSDSIVMCAGGAVQQVQDCVASAGGQGPVCQYMEPAVTAVNATAYYVPYCNKGTAPTAPATQATVVINGTAIPVSFDGKVINDASANGNGVSTGGLSAQGTGTGSATKGSSSGAWTVTVGLLSTVGAMLLA